MASIIDQLPLAFLLFLIAASSLQTQARESQYFSKLARNEPTKETTAVGKETPSMTSTTKEEFPPQSENGYGLYTHDDPNYLPPTTTTTTTTNNNYNENTNADSVPIRFTNQDFIGRGFQRKEPNAEEDQNRYNSNDAARYRTSDAAFGSADSESYGTSDTRGRYFYDANNNGETYREPQVRGNNYEGRVYDVDSRRGGGGGGGYGYRYSKPMEGVYRENEGYYIP